MGRIAQYCQLACSFVLAASLIGCSGSSARLKPGRGTHPVAGMPGAAVNAENQIEVIVQTGTWPGEPRIADGVEPIRVRIGNYGSRPVHVSYERFRLVAPDGRRYAVVPPLPARAKESARPRRAITPRFSYSAYRVAPHFGPVYSDLAVHQGRFLRAADPRDRVPYRRLGNLPTAEMVDWAIPEGVLEVSGFVDGYMFFERVAPEVKQVELQAVLVAPRNAEAKFAKPVSWVAAKTAQPEKPPAAEVVARVTFPFVVD